MKKNPIFPTPTPLPEKTPAKDLDAIAARAYEDWEKKSPSPEQEHQPEPPAARELLRDSTIQADTKSHQVRGTETPKSGDQK